MRLRSAVLTASIALIAAAPAAHAETWIGPGVEGMPTDPSYGTAGCQQPIDTCVLLQQDWTPSSAADDGAALPFPANGAFVITEFKVAVGLNVRAGLWVMRLTDPRTGYYKTLGEALGNAAASDNAIADTKVDPSLPIHQGDTIGIDIISEKGTVHLANGDGHYDVSPSDHDQNTDGFQTRTPGFGGTLAFEVRVEPDADGDGFGDETQDRCPGFPGWWHGCAPDGSGAPAPAPGPSTPAPSSTAPPSGSTGGASTIGGAAVPHRTARLSALRLSGTKLSYTLTTRLTRVRVKLERRRHGRWHAYATRAVSGTAGTHTVRVPRHRKGDRLVVSAAGKTVKIINLPR